MVKEHILIIEDEPDIQELIKFNLERKRYSVDINDSGEEALKTIDIGLLQCSTVNFLDVVNYSYKAYLRKMRLTIYEV